MTSALELWRSMDRQMWPLPTPQRWLSERKESSIAEPSGKETDVDDLHTALFVTRMIPRIM
jgi:hypothetical protein